MKLVDHKNNCRWWHKKINHANAEQVAEFAKCYQLVEPGAWAVTVTEGFDWIGAGNISIAVTATRAGGAIAVWISNGLFAQCIWRAENER